MDACAQNALDLRRVALAKERDVLGRAVFEALRKDLFDSPAALSRIPAGGFLTISLVPALLTVAAASDKCRRLCVDYVDSQLLLIDRCIAQALLRRRLDDRPVTQELRGFANAYRHAKAALAAPSGSTVQRDSADVPVTQHAVEAYLSGTVAH